MNRQIEEILKKPRLVGRGEKSFDLIFFTKFQSLFLCFASNLRLNFRNYN